jgi:propanediol dehydratase small subunit
MGKNVTASHRSAQTGKFVTTRKVSSGRMVTSTEARAAAKTRVTVDKKLGRKTPEWVTRLASDG